MKLEDFSLSQLFLPDPTVPFFSFFLCSLRFSKFFFFICIFYHPPFDTRLTKTRYTNRLSESPITTDQISCWGKNQKKQQKRVPSPLSLSLSLSPLYSFSLSRSLSNFWRAKYEVVFLWTISSLNFFFLILFYFILYFFAALAILSNSHENIALEGFSRLFANGFHSVSFIAMTNSWNDEMNVSFFLSSFFFISNDFSFLKLCMPSVIIALYLFLI